MMERIAQAKKLGRSFGRQDALRSIDFELRSGEILALVGSNGSGKTTLLKILAGLLRPSWGSVQVFGLDPFRQRARVMAQARFAFAPPPLYDNLTAREHLLMLGGISSNGSPRPGKQDVDRALATVGLSARADDRSSTYSFGMRQRLALAQALVPLPRLLVLDEPTDGLDPLAVLELRAVLERLRSEHQVTVLLSSHLLIEVESLVDRMLVLEQGRVLFDGAPAELRSGKSVLSLRVDDPVRALQALAESGLSPTAAADGTLELPSGSANLIETCRLLGAEGLELLEFHQRTPTLERALLQRIRDARKDTGIPPSNRGADRLDNRPAKES